MTVRKRGSVWWMDFTITGLKGQHHRVQRSTKTSDHALAQQMESAERARMWRSIVLGDSPSKTWADAVKLYRTEKAHLRSMSATLAVNIDWLCRHIADSTPLDQINSMIPDIRRARIEQRTRTGGAPKLATINMPMAVLSSILKLAVKRGYLREAPHIELPNPNNSRVRWLTHAEAGKLISQVRANRCEGFANLVEFSFETGVRQDNAVHLRPEWVNLSDWTITIPASEFKGRRSFTFPLSKRAQELVARGIAKGGRYLFVSERGTAFSRPNEDLKEDCAEAGISDFHWHDIRHTWATWHVRSGTPLEVLQKLGGWKDYATVLRYAVFAEDHIAAYADNASRAAGETLVTLKAAA